MERNVAGRSGGAVYILETSVDSLVDVRINSFEENIAAKGGAFFAQSVTRLQMNDNCNFTNNKAVSGGAMYLSIINSFLNEIELNDITFENNLVQISYEDLTFPDEVQDYLTLTAPIEDTSILLSKYSEDPCYPGGGGALCLATNDAPDAAILHVTLSDLIFRDNFGYVGGAAMLVTKDENREICGKEDCHYFTLDNCEFTGNVASGAGGALFAFTPKYITDKNREYNLIESEQLNLIFENNAVEEGGYGDDIAAGIANLRSIGSEPEAWSDINSGEDNIYVNIGIYDAFDQHIINAIQYSGMCILIIIKN